jgi:hypothetical protein
MTKEEHMRDTIDMAREVYGAHTEWSGAPLDRLEQLVALVRADEREQSLRREKFIAERWAIECASQVEIEREACAELVYNSPPSDEYESPLKAVYDAIRNRGKAK